MEIEKQYDKIYRYCFFKVNNKAVAEDITQEAFLRYFEKFGFSDSRLKLPYLYTIARNLCVDEYRKVSTEALDDHNELSNTADMESEIVKSVSVRNAIKQLDEAERELLLLRYVNDVPVSDIAGIYSISRFAVYRKLLQAKQKFMEHYDE